MIKHGEKTIMHFETWKGFWSHFQIIWQTLKENKQKTHYIKDIEALQWLANPNDELIVFSLGEKLANVTNITNNTSTSIILQHICFFFSLEIESLLISTSWFLGQDLQIRYQNLSTTVYFSSPYICIKSNFFFLHNSPCEQCLCSQPTLWPLPTF